MEQTKIIIHVSLGQRRHYRLDDCSNVQSTRGTPPPLWLERKLQQVINLDCLDILQLRHAISRMYTRHQQKWMDRIIVRCKKRECCPCWSKNDATCMLEISKAKNFSLGQYLLSISADIDHVDNDGNSALHHASAWGHLAVMELLVVSIHSDKRFGRRALKIDAHLISRRVATLTSKTSTIAQPQITHTHLQCKNI